MFIFLCLKINTLTAFDILVLLFSTFTHCTNTPTGRAPDPSSECINQKNRIYLQIYWTKSLLPHRSLAPWNAVIHQHSNWNILKFWKKKPFFFVDFDTPYFFFILFPKRSPSFFPLLFDFGTPQWFTCWELYDDDHPFYAVPCVSWCTLNEEGKVVPRHAIEFHTVWAVRARGSVWWEW